MQRRERHGSGSRRVAVRVRARERRRRRGAPAPVAWRGMVAWGAQCTFCCFGAVEVERGGGRREGRGARGGTKEGRAEEGVDGGEPGQIGTGGTGQGQRQAGSARDLARHGWLGRGALAACRWLAGLWCACFLTLAAQSSPVPGPYCLPLHACVQQTDRSICMPVAVTPDALPMQRSRTKHHQHLLLLLLPRGRPPNARAWPPAAHPPGEAARPRPPRRQW